MRTMLRVGVAISAIGLAWPEKAAIAQQQQAQAPALEEIVVTARKREESLMSVPIAVSAVTADEIQAAGIKDLNTLAQYTPGLWAENGVILRSTRQLTFRGLSVSSGLVFVDGAPFTGNSTPNLTNLERVEVLVGPQSAYFGRSTFQGAINFVTKSPGDEYAGQINAEYGRFATRDVWMTFEGPVIEDRLGIRVSGRHSGTDGHYRSVANNNSRMGKQATDSITSTIVFTPSDNFTARILLDQTLDNDGPGVGVALKGNKELFCQLGGTFGAYACGPLPKATKFPQIVSFTTDLTPYFQNVLFGNPRGFPTLFNTRYMEHVGLKNRVRSAHLNMDYDLASGWNFSSVTAVHRAKTQSIFSPDYRETIGVPNPLFPGNIAAGGISSNLFLVISQTILRDESQELRVTSPQDQRLRGTFGANYLHTLNPGTSTYGQGPTGILFTAGVINRTVSKTPAVFGGLYYDLTPELTLIAEARYQWDRLSSTPTYPVAGAKISGLFKSFSPRVTAEYKFGEDSMTYVLFSRGYRPGVFNTAIIGQPQSVLDQLAIFNAQPLAAQERLDNYEYGLKSTWLDGRLRTILALYYDIWSNGQVPNTLFFINAQGTQAQTTLVTNVGRTILSGVELQADAAITDELTVHGTLNYAKTEIKKYIFTPNGPRIFGTTDVIGNRFNGAPDWTWTISPTYRARLTGDWDWFARADYRHKGKYMVDPTNVTWIPPVDIFDAHLGVENESLRLEAYVKNITDNRDFVNAQYGQDAIASAVASTANEVRVWLPQKRTWGIVANYKF